MAATFNQRQFQAAVSSPRVQLFEIAGFPYLLSAKRLVALARDRGVEISADVMRDRLHKGFRDPDRLFQPVDSKHATAAGYFAKSRARCACAAANVDARKAALAALQVPDEEA